MGSLEEHAARFGIGAQPTGVPGDAVHAATAINEEIGRRVNLPGAATGVLVAGNSGQVADLAQVSIALSLADIAVSLRKLSGREDA